MFDVKVPSVQCALCIGNKHPCTNLALMSVERDMGGGGSVDKTIFYAVVGEL